MFDISLIHYLSTLNNNRQKTVQTKYLSVFYDEFGQNCAPWVVSRTSLAKLCLPGLEIGHFWVKMAPLGWETYAKYCILGWCEESACIFS